MVRFSRLRVRLPERSGHLAVLAAACATLELAPCAIGRRIQHLIYAGRGPTAQGEGRKVPAHPAYQSPFHQQQPSGQNSSLVVAAVPCALAATALVAAASTRRRKARVGGSVVAQQSKVARFALVDSLAATEAGRLNTALSNVARAPRELAAKLVRPLLEALGAAAWLAEAAPSAPRRAKGAAEDAAGGLAGAAAAARSAADRVTELPSNLKADLVDSRIEAAQNTAAAVAAVPGRLAAATQETAGTVQSTGEGILNLPGNLKAAVDEKVSGLQQLATSIGSLPENLGTGVQNTIANSQRMATNLIELPSKISSSISSTVDVARRTTTALVELPGNMAQMADSTVSAAKTLVEIPGRVRTRAEETLNSVQNTGAMFGGMAMAAISLPARAMATVEDVVTSSQQTVEVAQSAIEVSAEFAQGASTQAAAAAGALVGAAQAAKRMAAAENNRQLWEREVANRERLKATGLQLQALQKQMAELYPEEEKPNKVVARSPQTAPSAPPAVAQRPFNWGRGSSARRRGQWEMASGGRWRRG